MMFDSKIITKDDLKNKKVLVRVDFNVPLENGIVQDNSRIKNISPTIKFLKDAGAKIILISHLGKTAQFNQAQSLKNIIREITNEYKLKVVFIEDCLDENASLIIENTPVSNIILVENLRFHSEEENCDFVFAKRLASWADFYINEAFSVSHRKHASIFAIPKFLPHAFGLAFVSEIRTINNFFNNVLPPRICIIGGMKLSTKINLLKNLVMKVDKLALGGSVAGVFLSSLRKKSPCTPDSDIYAEEVSLIIENSQKYNCELIMPVDFMISNVEQKALYCSVASPEINAADIFDIGPRTVELFKHHLRESKTVLWNGPMGLFEKSSFENGTLSLAQEVSRLSLDKKLTSIICGGDTVFAVNKFQVSKNISHISTAGGAFLAYLEGTKLPGIEAQKDFYTLQE
ncbi:MAG: phosphoglycerate kinase [Holosporaceae bacterium]|jgi:phosphoglycerate kinase|nr:phosphoglycerate kinase [Holosporaceae bacterium]